MTEPLEGILKTGDFGDSKHYHVACSCGSTDCAHDVHVEVVGDDCDVSVNIYITANNDFWTEHFKTRYDHTSWQNPFKNVANAFLRKLKFTWEVWIKGETKFETTIVLSAPAAKNYSQALDKAADDVKLFKKQYVEKNAKRIKE